MAQDPKDPGVTNDSKFSMRYIKDGTVVYPERNYSNKHVMDSITKEFPYWSEFGAKDNVKPRDALYRAYQLYLQQSELKKPYQPGGYPAMEVGWSPPNWRSPTIDGPDPGDPLGPGGPGPGGAIIVFDLNCNAEDEAASDCDEECGFCPNDTVRVQLSCSEPCYWVQTTLEDDPATHIDQRSVKGYGTNTVSFDLICGEESGFVTIEASMTSVEGVTGSSNVNLPECDSCCDFTLTLVREDGTVVDASLLVQFQVVRATLGWTTSFSQEYKGSGKWCLNITGARDPNEVYFLRYQVKSGDVSGRNLWTQYPYRYKELTDWGNPSDAVPPGAYSDTPPYYDVTTPFDLTPVKFTDLPIWDAGGNCGSPYYNWNDSAPGLSGIHVDIGGSIRFEGVVKSSITYRVRIRTLGSLGIRLGGLVNAALSGAYTCFVGGVSTPYTDVCYGLAFLRGFCCGGGLNPTYFYHGNLMVEWDVDASDGLNTFTYSGDKDAEYPKYDSQIEVAGSISGKTHYIEYTPTAINSPIEFTLDHDIDYFGLDCQTHSATTVAGATSTFTGSSWSCRAYLTLQIPGVDY
jgi:hypothetical protein